MDELGIKPCPFCGGKNNLNIQSDMVWCGDCDCAGPQVTDGECAAVDAWNERTENGITKI